jgi:hypothetical protein
MRRHKSDGYPCQELVSDSYEKSGIAEPDHKIPAFLFYVLYPLPADTG